MDVVREDMEVVGVTGRMWKTGGNGEVRATEETSTVEPRYNEVLWTMKITLLYQVSHYIRVTKQRDIKSWDQ